MELHKIDSIQKLRQERLRLQQEANVAQELLHLKVQGTIDSSKVRLLGSWKVLLPVAITAGIQHFVKNSAPRTTTAATDENAFFATFQEGFQAFQRPSHERWGALIPVLLRLWELWQNDQTENPVAPVSTPTTKETAPLTPVSF
ncbi:hypothetical protein [Lewinella sp. LCG006]|uniref:hypothetical protein n=1 Tax=Lewinella sp. LCG006 TaxID=3231911 RepID=UPI003461511F